MFVARRHVQPNPRPKRQQVCENERQTACRPRDQISKPLSNRPAAEKLLFVSSNKVDMLLKKFLRHACLDASHRYTSAQQNRTFPHLEHPVRSAASRQLNSKNPVSDGEGVSVQRNDSARIAHSIPHRDVPSVLLPAVWVIR